MKVSVCIYIALGITIIIQAILAGVLFLPLPHQSQDLNPIPVIRISYSREEFINALHAQSYPSELGSYLQVKGFFNAVWALMLSNDDRRVTRINFSHEYIATMASVAAVDQSLKLWEVTYNPILISNMTGGQEIMVYRTIVHELIHILTLNETQIEPDTSTEVGSTPRELIPEFVANRTICKTYYIPEGCTRPSSYLYKFYSGLWREYYPSVQEFNRIERDDEYAHRLLVFFDQHKEFFMTQTQLKAPRKTSPYRFRCMLSPCRMKDLYERKSRFLMPILSLFNLGIN